MPTLVRDGRELYYEVAGDGPAVVFIHAGIADMSQWDAQVEALRDRFRVVRYDVAGFGRSPLAPGAFSHVRDLHALLEHLGVVALRSSATRTARGSRSSTRSSIRRS